MQILASVLSAPSHSSSVEEISQFIRSQYGISGSLAKLGSERDENYRIILSDGTERLFKLTHVLEDPALVDFQTKALLHLAAVAPDLPVPRLVPSLSGDIETSAPGSDGRARQARMFTFLAGAPLSGFPRSATQAAGLGVLSARLDAALASFHHPAAGHEFLWDIQHAVRTRELLTHTPSAADRGLCERTLDRFERGLARNLGGFRAQVIHNDLNPHNLLVDPARPDELTGIIDFGDMVLAPLADEVAVASAYLLAASPAPLGTVPEFVAAYHSILPLRSQEIAALPQLIALRHAITILITNWRAARYPDNRDYILRNQHHAIAGLQKLSLLPESTVQEWLLGVCPGAESMSTDPIMINSFDPRRSSELPDNEQALVTKRQRLLGPAYRLFYEHPVHLVRGEGVWLYDAEGAAYLDVYNNVPSVGHCHPRVVEAIARQAGQLNIHTRYLHAGILDYSEMLLATFPSELSQVMYTCTGSEANDLAVRVARQFTGGTGFIVTQLAYHGVTDTIAGMSPSLGEHVMLGPHVRTVPAPRSASGAGAAGAAPAAVGRAFAGGVEAALEDMARQGIKPAALLVDTIFSSDGVFADPAGFLEPAVDAVRRAGGLFVADEVQPGFGRTGDAMWGFQRHSLVPDIVTLGKPMGNGYPVAAVVAKPEVLAPFGSQCRYFNTFGGNPVAMAAARAVLEVISEERLRERALETGRYLRSRLAALSDKFEAIGDVRGAGLFIGVELIESRATRSPATRLAGDVINELRRRRVLISAAGPGANVLKIRPPLPFGPPQADLFLSALEASLAHVINES